jgi:hypothetical protein
VRYRPPGYALVVPRASVDLHRFEDLVRRGDEAAAAELLRQASTLHRGPAFQGLEEVAELALESDRLAELRGARWRSGSPPSWRWVSMPPWSPSRARWSPSIRSGSGCGLSS